MEFVKDEVLQAAKSKTQKRTKRTLEKETSVQVFYFVRLKHKTTCLKGRASIETH